jgi:hypothetical protein
MGRHLELKGLARQQQQELEERERRAFKLQVEEARSPFTVRASFLPLLCGCVCVFCIVWSEVRQGACTVQSQREQRQRGDWPQCQAGGVVVFFVEEVLGFVYV